MHLEESRSAEKGDTTEKTTSGDDPSVGTGSLVRLRGDGSGASFDGGGMKPVRWGDGSSGVGGGRWSSLGDIEVSSGTQERGNQSLTAVKRSEL
jgi:hypothetical protein